MSNALVVSKAVSLFLPNDPARKIVLSDIFLTIQQGEHCAVMGKNGSGKSTLLRLLAGLLWPSSGTIEWLESDGSFSTSPLSGRALSSLVSPAEQLRYQKHAWSLTGLTFVLTGFEATTYLYDATGIDAQTQERVRVLAQELACDDLLYRDISQLSQGQLRILLLCRALIKEPKLLLLDECCDGLDQTHMRVLFALFEKIAEKTTLVFVTHDTKNIPSFCSKLLYLDCGKLSQEKPASLGCKYPVSDIEFPKVEKAPYPAFAISNASVYLDRVEVLHSVSATINIGERLLLVGDNGSGKSTFLRLLIGDVFCAAGGSIRRYLPKLHNKNGGFVESLEQIRSGISLVSSRTEYTYDYPLTAFEVVCSGFDNSVGLYRSVSNEEKSKAENTLRAFFPDLSDSAFSFFMGTPIHMLSTGQMRRLFLARALLCEPDVLLLDEPLSGLDSESSRLYLALLDSLAGQSSITMVFVTHSMDAIPRCITSYAEMVDGTFTAKDAP